jgi:hypothetical protein
MSRAAVSPARAKAERPEASETHAPFFRRVGVKAHQLAHARALGVQQRARVGFGIGARLDQDEPAQHRLGAPEPTRHQSVRGGDERVPRGDILRRAEEIVEHPEHRPGRAPKRERGCSGGGWGGVCGHGEA